VRKEPKSTGEEALPSLRYFCAFTVSSMLGHYDAGFTLRTYTHATRQKQDEAAQTMGSFVAKTPKMV